METLIEQLNQLFSRMFPGSIAELEAATPLEKVGGFVIWEGFEGAEQLDRQRQIHRVLRENLSPEDQARLTTILTLTPEEAMTMRAG